MTKTVTSLFDDQTKGHAVVSRLEQAGISRENVTLYANDSSDLIDDLDDLGIPAADAHAYAEGIRRGGALITVSCDEDEVDRVISVLDGEGIVDLDERESAWRNEGWQGYEGTAGSSAASGLGAAAAGLGGALSGTSDRTRASDSEWDPAGSGNITEARSDLDADRSRTSATSQTGLGDSGNRDEVIPVAEEVLHVGKREVSHGRVRINSRVVERPVQEQVTLRDETVEVERRPVSGEYREGTVGGDPFQERTVEVEERDEEAVVSKEARVKEELVVRKGVEQRTETVSDTVRKTEVDVEDERGARGTGTTGSKDRKL
jgi:uncharacterized protein (TIGR02271 family)